MEAFPMYAKGLSLSLSLSICLSVSLSCALCQTHTLFRVASNSALLLI
jgi:hypothetical protein